MPAESDGSSFTVIEPALVTVKQAETGEPGHGVVEMGVVSTVTRVALNSEPDMKPDPATVIVLRPARGPLPGVTLVTVGTGAYAYSSAGVIALVPAGVSTVMSTVPGPSDGRSLMVMELALTTVKHGDVTVPGHGFAVIGVVSTVTSEAFVKSLPLRVTVFVPPSGPAVGETPVTAGTGW